MSSLISKEDEKVTSKDQKPTTDLGSVDDNKPEIIESKVVLYQPATADQEGEASGTVAEDDKSKELIPTTDKKEPDTSKTKDETSFQTDVNQPGMSEQSSSGKEKRSRRSILELPPALKRTSARLKKNSVATTNVLEQVDSGKRNPKKRRVALFLDVHPTAKK